ncbi:MAG TPA: ribose 5-phosphate isomerase B [Polyangiaceae bacterium LLY-WYZ-15_(1-7)]|nr:ribose 5-phosphate isomerase B [Myxococcales bacterium]MAT24667.1 ribose 5-phosphate isomerase B [Sandaracinus sp.]HJK93323.1 ribose 5-phosphate isomerase B [Polyangiaceae bacterium LLY-WYZ-15_(1-7)]MBJ72544.1 ribose 5-phosphate isomerase B [Sandaracinus sp.]HJL06357.1 ribose 5-phosphate isomerase B [Polyangiaceae bacterium LLY-WYZ-15_(1-7)]
MKVFVGGDHAGFPLKQEMVEVLKELGHEVEDVGVHSTESADYPDFAHPVAAQVAATEGALGLLICGSGQGVCMTANKHPGVRAALCHEPWSAAMTRAHNDANVLCMGARVVGGGLARATLEAFLAGRFEGGRHARRVGKIELPEGGAA